MQTRLNIMYRCKSCGIAPQLRPWLHRTPGHAIVTLFKMKIKRVDREERPLLFTTHFIQFILHYGFSYKAIYIDNFILFFDAFYKICETMNIAIWMVTLYIYMYLTIWYNDKFSLHLAIILQCGWWNYICIYLTIWYNDKVYKWCKCQHSSHHF